MDYDGPINNQDKNLAINILLMDQSNTKSMLYNPTTNTRRIRERGKKSQMNFSERMFKDFLPLSFCLHSCLQRYNPTLLNFSLIQKQHALLKKKESFIWFIYSSKESYISIHSSKLSRLSSSTTTASHDHISIYCAHEFSLEKAGVSRLSTKIDPTNNKYQFKTFYQDSPLDYLQPLKDLPYAKKKGSLWPKKKRHLLLLPTSLQ